MSKKPQTQDQFEAELKSELPVYDSPAITILPTHGGFNVVKILVDSKNLKAGEVLVLSTATSKSEAIEKFKIEVVRNGII